MGQPDSVNQLPDRARPLNPKFNDIEKLLPELTLQHHLFGTYMYFNEVKGVTFNLF